jgi:hypothetical protein
MTGVSDHEKKAKKTRRLAAALRENLRRRKAQVRQRGAAPAQPPKDAKDR